tara:strand:- start:661 stop:840 length:180 start_codon:yes stop_codon:yes gene_type:complete
MRVLLVVALLFMLFYFWYKIVMRVDRIFFEGRSSNLFLYFMLGIGWVLIGVGLAKLLGV